MSFGSRYTATMAALLLMMSYAATSMVSAGQTQDLVTCVACYSPGCSIDNCYLQCASQFCPEGFAYEPYNGNTCNPLPADQDNAMTTPPTVTTPAPMNTTDSTSASTENATVAFMSLPTLSLCYKCHVNNCIECPNENFASGCTRCDNGFHLVTMDNSTVYCRAGIPAVDGDISRITVLLAVSLSVVLMILSVFSVVVFNCYRLYKSAHFRSEFSLPVRGERTRSSSDNASVLERRLNPLLERPKLGRLPQCVDIGRLRKPFQVYGIPARHKTVDDQADTVIKGIEVDQPDTAAIEENMDTIQTTGTVPGRDKVQIENELLNTNSKLVSIIAGGVDNQSCDHNKDGEGSNEMISALAVDHMVEDYVNDDNNILEDLLYDEALSSSSLDSLSAGKQKMETIECLNHGTKLNCMEDNIVDEEQGSDIASLLTLSDADWEEIFRESFGPDWRSGSESDLIDSCGRSIVSYHSERTYISLCASPPSETYVYAAADSKSIQSERDPMPFQLEWLTKSFTVDRKNELFTYQTSTAVQTESSVTTPKVKTVFCTDWQFGGTFTPQGGELQASGSDIVLTMPPRAVPRGEAMDIYGAIFTDSLDIRKKFSIPDDESLVSPLVEYIGLPTGNFERNINIHLPHALPPDVDTESVKVYTYTVDDRGAVTVSCLPFRSKSNTSSVGEAYWEEDQARHKICISSPHFSGYFCTLCGGSSRVPSICTMIFGSHVQIQHKQRSEIRIVMYIWDHRLTIKDYQEKLCLKEKEADRQFLTDMQVPLLNDVPSDSRLVMRMDFLNQNGAQCWIHVTRDGGSRYLFKPLQVRRLSEIIECCRNTEPNRVEWAIENKPYMLPGPVFQCCIDIMHAPESTSDFETALDEDVDNLMRSFYVQDLEVSHRHYAENKMPSQNMKIENATPVLKLDPTHLKQTLPTALTLQQAEELCLEFGFAPRDIGNFRKKFSSEYSVKEALIEECIRRLGPDKLASRLPTLLDKLQVRPFLNAMGNQAPPGNETATKGVGPTINLTQVLTQVKNVEASNSSLTNPKCLFQDALNETLHRENTSTQNKEDKVSNTNKEKHNDEVVSQRNQNGAAFETVPKHGSDKNNKNPLTNGSFQNSESTKLAEGPNIAHDIPVQHDEKQRSQAPENVHYHSMTTGTPNNKCGYPTTNPALGGYSSFSIISIENDDEYEDSFSVIAKPSSSEQPLPSPNDLEETGKKEMYDLQSVTFV